MTESVLCNLLIVEREKVLENLELKLDSQLQRLQGSIDFLTKEVHTSFKSLHERIDILQKNLEVSKGPVWNNLKHHLDRRGSMAARADCKETIMLPPGSTNAQTLESAAEMARDKIRDLSGLLVLHKDADRMSAKGFHDREAMLMKMINPYLKKPYFEQFWHVKHGIDHCVASILFKASHVLAMTRSVMEGTHVGPDSAQFYEELQFKRFCKKSMKALESFAEWDQQKWSKKLKKQFVNTLKAVWMLQSMMAAAMSAHQVEILHHEPGVKFDVQSMEPLEFTSGDCGQLQVQFTVFHGFKVDNVILVKPQVYLYPKVPRHDVQGTDIIEFYGTISFK